MKHKNYYEDYNEIMYNERDLIESFLEKKYDIRYGRQRDTWHFEPAVELVAHQGSHVLLHDIKLDKDKFVLFYVEAFCEKNAEWECSDFAYGELSKVIEALPEPDEIVKRNAIQDITSELDNGNIVWTTGARHIVADGSDVIMVTKKGDGINVILRKFDINSKPIKLECLSSKVIAQIRDHINVEVLHRSNEYKKLMELLALQENLSFECANYGDATFVVDKTDMTFDVSSIRRDDKGNLVIYGGDIDADICDGIKLEEKDIKPQYLDCILEAMEIATKKYTITLGKQSVDDVLNALSFRSEHVNEEVRDRLSALLNNIEEQIKDQG